MISLIVALATTSRVIGLDDGMPWKLRQDLQRFKSLTTGHVVLMGRKTYSSIGRPLPNRTNVVLTRDATFDAPGCFVRRDLRSTLLEFASEGELFVIGGAEIYAATLHAADRIYATFVDYDGPGDTIFPEDLALDFEPTIPWEEIGVDVHNTHATRYSVLERCPRPAC